MATITITREVFEKETALLTDVLVDQVLTEKAFGLSSDQTAWFKEHVNHRLCWLYANNSKWHIWLSDQGRVDPRLQAKVWIRHWLDAYVRNPDQYEDQHPPLE